MKFTEEHEWLESDGEMVKVGITESVSYTHLTLPTIAEV